MGLVFISNLTKNISVLVARTLLYIVAALLLRGACVVVVVVPPERWATIKIVSDVNFQIPPDGLDMHHESGVHLTGGR